ncbi:MAG: signal peptidase II [Calothrix sp. SM1_5_4]|nr:signal peptidase II [Calothrix sp. SM1_5_4]
MALRYQLAPIRLVDRPTDQGLGPEFPRGTSLLRPVRTGPAPQLGHHLRQFLRSAAAPARGLVEHGRRVSVFIYAAIQYLLPSRSLPLRSGMSLLLGGIIGNVTDRIVTGAVTDFLVLGSRQLSTPAFNFADAIQWVGYVLVVYGLIRDGSLFWPDTNVRKTVWINPRFQLKYCLTIVAIGACFPW